MTINVQFTDTSKPKNGWSFAILPALNIGLDPLELLHYIELYWLTFHVEITIKNENLNPA